MNARDFVQDERGSANHVETGWLREAAQALLNRLG